MSFQWVVSFAQTTFDLSHLVELLVGACTVQFEFQWVGARCVHHRCPLKALRNSLVVATILPQKTIPSLPPLSQHRGEGCSTAPMTTTISSLSGTHASENSTGMRQRQRKMQSEKDPPLGDGNRR
jgi:hypothetical protein